jgi:hypothetical protein
VGVEVNGRDRLVRALAAGESHHVVTEHGLAGPGQTLTANDEVDVAGAHHGESRGDVTSCAHHCCAPPRSHPTRHVTFSALSLSTPTALTAQM